MVRAGLVLVRPRGEGSSVLSRLLGKAGPSAPGRTASVPEGRRLYVIGDIHGRRDLLDRIADAIAADVALGAPRETLAVLLGDYIDRGPDSAGVLARLSSRDFPIPFVALRGNHEQMLLDFLEDERCLEAWRHFGGLETLHSFGIDVQKARQVSGFAEAQHRLKEVLDPRMERFLAATASYYVAGDYYFCHAGIRPGIPLAEQRDSDLLWIREEFVASSANHGKIIVHGHTPVEAPDVRENRINIDTGAYATGRLTCLVLERDTRRLLST
jgi:serine/threonine protein phosphatase 1